MTDSISKPEKFLFKVIGDPSTLLLVFSNLAAVFLAVWQGWNVLMVLWVYWFQSVIIGFFNFLRILSLKDLERKIIR